MASLLSKDVISQATPYWYERIPFVADVNLSSGGTEPIIPQLTGWNTSQSPQTLCTLEELATVRDPNLSIRVSADGDTRTFYASSHPPNLEPLPVGIRAVTSLTATAQALSGPTIGTSPIVYSVGIYQLPLTWKVLLGYTITEDERAIADALGLTTSPIAQNGQHPIPIGTMIERTFLNRQVASPIVYDGPSITFSSSLTVDMPQINVPPNTIAVLHKVGIGVSADYGPSFVVNRDNQANHVQIQDASVATITRPLSMWVPAENQIQITVQVAEVPPGPVPVRVEAYTISLSNILRIRMSLITGRGLEALFQAQVRAAAQAEGRAPTPEELAAAARNADAFRDKVLAGVM
jgi:hypothetical protein